MDNRYEVMREQAIAPTPIGERILELEYPCGVKMRIDLKGADAPDLGTISSALWSAKRILVYWGMALWSMG